MQQINIQYFESPCGELILGSFNNKLIMADWRNRKKRERIDNRLQSKIKAKYIEKKDDVLHNTQQQLTEYFNAKRTKFDLPIQVIGTEFQQKVWDALIQIPYGKTCSYQKLANNIKNAKAVRAVANANAANAISIIIPCHRIIAKNGGVAGYAGGLSAKKQLLSLENNLFE